LKEVLTIGLKLLHPFMPFITEEIFCTLWEEKESIMLESWPVMREEYRFEQEEAWLETVKEVVRQIRNVRSGMDVPPSRKAKVFLVTQVKEDIQALENLMGTYHSLAMASEIIIQQEKQGIGEDAVSVVTSHGIVYLPLEDLVDFEKEKERLQKEKSRLEKEVSRSEGMLKNDKFMSKAAPEKVTEEKDKLDKYGLMLQQVEQRLAQLK
jgi:valyl-tRNA synthetase